MLDPQNKKRKSNIVAPKVIDPNGKLRATRIDKIARKMFPMAFTVFMVVYWVVYTLPSAVTCQS